MHNILKLLLGTPMILLECLMLMQAMVPLPINGVNEILHHQDFVVIYFALHYWYNLQLLLLVRYCHLHLLHVYHVYICPYYLGLLKGQMFFVLI